MAWSVGRFPRFNMADVTFDGQAFLVDRRRVFPVGGTLHHAASPAAEWPRRLAAARRAGLNCIETAVPWLLHEPSPGEFDFSGRADLGRFLRLAGEAGLFVRLRMGPYVGAGFAGGGLPAWLPEVPTTKKSGPMKARESSDPFMAACTRWYTRLMEEVAPLQAGLTRAPRTVDQGERQAGATAGPLSGYAGEGGGPVISLQSEHRWLCHHPGEHAAYHRTLVRFLLEGGACVPITAANQLWQPVDGAVQTWAALAGGGSPPEGDADPDAASADPGIAGIARQLVAVQPGQPRIVEILPSGTRRSAADELVAVAEALATGAMPHLGAFEGGRRLGFDAGDPSAESSEPVPGDHLFDADGRPAPGLLAVRPLLSFAASFPGVFTGMSGGGSKQAAVLRPASSRTGVSLVPLEGASGSVLFLFRGEDDRSDAAVVLLPDGRSLRVPLGDARVAWVPLGLRLGAAGALGHASLPLLGFFHERMLVFAGPAGARGELELNGARHVLPVPARGAVKPTIVPLGASKLVAVVLNDSQLETAAVVAEGLCLGVDPWAAPAEAGADAADAEVDASIDRPVPPAAVLRPAGGHDERRLIAPDGSVVSEPQTGPRRPPAPRLSDWDARGTAGEVLGTASGYTPIPALGTPARHDPAHGDAYGWLTLDNSGAAAARPEPTVFPGGAGRMHVFCDGQEIARVGPGAGATCDPVELSLAGRISFLVAGGVRPLDGLPEALAPGLCAAPVAVKEVPLDEPQVATTRAPDPFKIAAYVPGRSTEDAPLGSRLTWSVKLLGKKPLLARGPVSAAGTVVLNDKPVARVGPGAGACPVWRLDPGDEASPVKSGGNELVIHFDTVLDDPLAAVAELRLYREETDRTPAGKGVWSFCPWQRPDFDADPAPPKPKKSKSRGKAAEPVPPPSLEPVPGQPVWLRCRFTAKRLDFPLHLDLTGLSRGVVMLNGHVVSRYHLATPGTKPAKPKPRPTTADPLSLPAGWLDPGGDNELVIFDEHGCEPSKVKLRWG